MKAVNKFGRMGFVLENETKTQCVVENKPSDTHCLQQDTIAIVDVIREL